MIPWLGDDCFQQKKEKDNVCMKNSSNHHLLYKNNPKCNHPCSGWLPGLNSWLLVADSVFEQTYCICPLPSCMGLENKGNISNTPSVVPCAHSAIPTFTKCWYVTIFTFKAGYVCIWVFDCSILTTIAVDYLDQIFH